MSKMPQQITVIKGNMEVNTVGIQGPTGPKGPQGDPAFLQFRVEDGNLILEQNNEDYAFSIEGEDLIVNF